MLEAYLTGLDLCGPPWNDMITDREAAKVAASCQRGLVAAVHAGVMRYDARRMATCLRGISTQCALDAPFDACDEALHGTLDEGEPCYDTGECDEGACERSEQCPGRCLGYAPSGDQCGFGGGERDCKPPQFCDRDSRCSAPGPEGTRCESDRTCESPLICDYDHDFGEPVDKGRCVPRAAAGEPCYHDDECKRGLVCEHSADSGRSQCQDAPPRGLPGDLCDGDARCKRGLFCLTADPGGPCIAAWIPVRDDAEEPQWEEIELCGIDGWCQDGRCVADDPRSEDECIRPR
jgi:hypothetical protein